MNHLSLTQVLTSSYSFIPPKIEETILEYYQDNLLKNETESDKFVNQQVSLETLKAIAAVKLLHARKRTVLQPMGNAPSPVEVWDDSHQPPKLVVTRMGKWGPDAKATACFNNMMVTDDFCRTVLARYPVNNTTKCMKAHINFVGAYNNAFWNPVTHSIYFGDVDPRFFNPLVLNLDVTAHEFGHALTQFTADLEYQDQSGALNESMSDVFAIQLKHRQNKTVADKANWLIGDKLIVNDRKSGALRSMQNPGSAFDHPILGKDQQPNHMRDYLNTLEDNGGVHTNSGIPNHAFYLVSTGIGGNSWEKPGKIWFNALTHAQKQDDFSTFARRTIQAAKDLKFDEGTQSIVNKAWYDVGVDLRDQRVLSAPRGILAQNKEPVINWGKTAGSVILVGGIAATFFALGYNYAKNSIKSE